MPRPRLLLLLFVLALLAGTGPLGPAPALAQTVSQTTADPPSEDPDAESDEETPPERVPYVAPHPEGADGIAIPLEFSRRPLPNFLTDEIANIPHTAPDGLRRDFAETFTIGSSEARFAAVWDPRSCRLVGVLDLSAPPSTPREAVAPEPDGDTDDDSTPEDSEPSPYLMRAAGPAPLLGSPGGGGASSYFGFRLVEGKPEFLHIVGSLLVEERIWFENGGDVLLQRFAVREPSAELVLTLPEDWAERCVASHGTWRGNSLTVPANEADSLILAYRLKPPAATATEEDDTTPNESADP